MKKLNVTIGISAYNEAHNIVELLRQLLEQRGSLFNLKKIIVHSDGSTDETVRVIRNANLKKVIVTHHHKQMGKAIRLNLLCKEAESDVLVILDADVVIVDPLFIEKLIRPISENVADLTSGKVIALPVQNYVQRILQSSIQFKMAMFETIKNGNNVYTCHGRSRALSQKLYTQIKFQDSDNEDAFSFLMAKKLGLKYQYVSQAHVYYKLPLTLADHAKQSLRYLSSKRALADTFSEKIVAKEYKFPRHKLMPILLKTFLTDPYFALYLVVHAYLLIKAQLIKRSEHTWDIASSSKIIRNRGASI